MIRPVVLESRRTRSARSSSASDVLPPAKQASSTITPAVTSGTTSSMGSGAACRSSERRVDSCLWPQVIRRWGGGALGADALRLPRGACQRGTLGNPRLLQDARFPLRFCGARVQSLQLLHGWDQRVFPRVPTSNLPSRIKLINLAITDMLCDRNRVSPLTLGPAQCQTMPSMGAVLHLSVASFHFISSLPVTSPFSWKCVSLDPFGCNRELHQRRWPACRASFAI